MDEVDQILSGKAAASGPELNANDLLLVSKKVTAGAPVLFIFRDAPSDGDSGWVLLAGDEPGEWLEDRANFEQLHVEWALDYDPSLVAILGAPADTALERGSLSGEWVELEEE